MWFSLALLSAFLLGFYDVAKKNSLNSNAVIPVLFLTTLFNSLLFSPLMILSWLSPESLANTPFLLTFEGIATHLQTLLKAVIVLSSWLLAYFAMKHLPITITSPIKATQPVIVLIGALIVFHDRLNLYQWAGVIFAILSFYLLSKAGKKEGIHFKHNKWIVFIVLSVVMGAISSLYDKYLMTSLTAIVVQVYYNFYQLIIMGLILAFLWYPQRSRSTPFKWRWSIVLISIFLSASDFVYFYALSDEKALVSVVSMIRRSGVIITFFAGAFLFGERNLKRKAFDLILVVIGMIFLYLGSK